MTDLVLFIPRVFTNISKEKIYNIFDNLNMGEIDKVDIVKKTDYNNKEFNKVFIHYKQWNDSENAETVRNKLLNGGEVKVIYDNFWFWKVSAYKKQEYKPKK
jgi:hypothetical protein